MATKISYATCLPRQTSQSFVNYLMVLIEILLKGSTSGLFLKLVASVLPRRAFTRHRRIVAYVVIDTAPLSRNDHHSV